VRKLLPIVLVAAALLPIGAISASATRDNRANHQVMVPEADRFLPFGLVIHAGDAVRWTNGDEDDHTIVTDDALTTAGHHGLDRLLVTGGKITLRFDHAGIYVYYCRFHAHLDEFNQPVAPGPDGGIQDPNGNYGTPMSGVITVLP
jgi:plastocyanin